MRDCLTAQFSRIDGEHSLMSVENIIVKFEFGHADVIGCRDVDCNVIGGPGQSRPVAAGQFNQRSRIGSDHQHPPRFLLIVQLMFIGEQKQKPAADFSRCFQFGRFAIRRKNEGEYRTPHTIFRLSLSLNYRLFSNFLQCEMIVVRPEKFSLSTGLLNSSRNVSSLLA